MSPPDRISSGTTPYTNRPGCWLHDKTVHHTVSGELGACCPKFVMRRSRATPTFCGTSPHVETPHGKPPAIFLRTFPISLTRATRGVKVYPSLVFAYVLPLCKFGRTLNARVLSRSAPRPTPRTPCQIVGPNSRELPYAPRAWLAFNAGNFGLHQFNRDSRLIRAGVNPHCGTQTRPPGP